MIDALFGLLQRHATRFMAVSLFVGLVFQDLAALLKPVVFPFAVATMLLALVRLDWREVLAYSRRPGLAILVSAGALVAAPVAVTGVVALFNLEPALATGIILVSACPPIMSAPAYAFFIGLDAALAMVVAVPATIATPLVMPPILLEVIGLDLEIGIVDFAQRLAVMVALSFGGAWLIRCLYSQAEIDARARYFDGAVVFFISSFGIGVMDGIAPVVAADPAKSLLYCAAAFLLNAGLQVAGAVAAWRMRRRQALTIGLLIGNRNVILILAAVASTAGPDVLLYLVAAQLPLYVMPLLMRPLCARLIAARSSSDHQGLT